MKNNIGSTDRLVRVVGGVVLAAVGLGILGELFGFGLGTTVGVVVTLLGIVLAATGVVRLCLVYRLLGIDTSGSR